MILLTYLSKQIDLFIEDLLMPLVFIANSVHSAWHINRAFLRTPHHAPQIWPKLKDTNRKRVWLVTLWGLILSILIFSFSTPTYAKSSFSLKIQETSVTYTVQPGDTPILIALQHNLSPAEIALTNELAHINLVFPGQQLILPGVENPTPSPVPTSISSQVQHIAQPGDTVNSIANLYGVLVNDLITLNNLQNPDFVQIGQVFYIPEGPPPTPSQLRPPFENVTLSEETIIQGRTLTVLVSLAEGTMLSGIFEGNPLLFYNKQPNKYWGIIPIHALYEPDIYPITLVATQSDGTETTHFANVTVSEGPYGLEHIQLDESRKALLDADTLALEREKLVNLWSQVTLQPQWEGPFLYPVVDTQPRITSYFGTRRTYNNSEELSFHGGTDFGGGVGTPIYAPAAGSVVLAEPLTVRGNAVIIDHGMGLFSSYWHQSQLVITEGQQLQPGDLIGYIGSTGLVTGPHLHWEIRLNGIAVEPLQWVRESIP